MRIDGQRLLNLLPALYRLRDAEIASAQAAATGQALMPGPLESLLNLVAEQLAIVADDLDQLYDDQFIETCAPWVIPYIGDLIGYKAVNGVAPAVASPRAEVAHTISFRRRKGTVLVLEQLARDVTGWGGHAIEYFRLLSSTQHMNHIRPSSGGTADLRQWKLSEYINTGFDSSAHFVDVRNSGLDRGGYNIPNIGIFLWSLNAYGQTMSPASPLASNIAAGAPCFRISPLGMDVALFNNPVSQGAKLTSAALPFNVPDRLTRRVLCQDLQSAPNTILYGQGKSLALYLNGTLLAPTQIQVCNLEGPDGSWMNLPAADSPYVAALDPELGRLALPPLAAGGSLPTLQTTSYYGFNADMGGGEYPRASSFSLSVEQVIIRVPKDHPTIHEALAALGGDGVVEISNSGTYTEPDGLTISVKAGGHIELRAAEGTRPTLVLGAEITVTGEALGAIDFNGMILTWSPTSVGAIAPAALLHVPADADNHLGHLGLTHCTLVPGWPLASDGTPASPATASLLAEVPGLSLVMSKSICGGVRLHPLATASLSDSFIDASSTAGIAYAAPDGQSGAAPLTMTACTVIGKLHSVLFSLVSNSIVLANASTDGIWASPFWADRRQSGCVRFSYLPAGSIVPQSYECVTQAPGVAEPRLYSLRYGDAAYGKLLPSTDDLIQRGADDGGEMGAFHFELAPMREADLRVRLSEYLAVGMECRIVYAT